MFTEQSLRDHPSVVKAFMGLSAEQFWELVQQMQERFATYTAQQQQRPDRQRAVGAGHPPDLPLPIRTALVLTYLRLHIPQATVAALFVRRHPVRCVARFAPPVAPDPAVPALSRWSGRTCPLTKRCPSSTQLTAAESGGRAGAGGCHRATGRPPADWAEQKAYYSGKKHQHTLKTQIVTDGEHHIQAISVAVPGATHDKALSDRVQTLAHLPDGCEADADKGYQGLAAQVPRVVVRDPTTGTEQVVRRPVVQTPYKKPRGGELTTEQAGVQCGAECDPHSGGALYRLGQELGDPGDALPLCPCDLHCDHAARFVAL